MEKLFSMMIAITFMIAFTSCEKEALDGDWEKMKWEKVSYTTERYQGCNYYKVPKEGGTYTFKCKNYPGFWLCNVLVVDLGYGSNSETYYLPNDDNPHKLECEVATVNVENQAVTISIAPQSENSLRIINLQVTGGDIFDDINFIQ